MISVLDIANIVYRDCEVFGIERVAFGRTLTGHITEDRCVIHVKEQRGGKIWLDTYVEVNLCVPDLAPLYTEADTRRLNNLLDKAESVWKDGITGSCNGTPYYYEVSSTTILPDTTLRCHYANIRLLFHVLNVMEVETNK